MFPAITPQAARLTQLPYDILWEILAYFPTIPNWEVERNQTVLNPKYLQRYQILRALSQTCRALRFQCHPHLWEHIQACLLKEGGKFGSFYMQVGEALQKQSQILVSALPELQPLVRYVQSQSHPLKYLTL
jgi:F-box-like